MENKLTQIRDLIEDEVSEPTWQAVKILLKQIQEDYDGALAVAFENLGNRIEVKRLRMRVMGGE